MESDSSFGSESCRKMFGLLPPSIFGLSGSAAASSSFYEAGRRGSPVQGRSIISGKLGMMSSLRFWGSGMMSDVRMVEHELCNLLEDFRHFDQVSAVRHWLLVKSCCSRINELLSSLKRHEPFVQDHRSRIDELLSPLTSEIFQRFELISEGIRLHELSILRGSRPAAASSSSHAAEPDDQPVKRSSSYEFLPPNNPDVLPMRRSSSFSCLLPDNPHVLPMRRSNSLSFLSPNMSETEKVRMNHPLITGPQVPPGHHSNVHREGEKKPIEEQEWREKDQTIREEPEEPVKLHCSRSDDSLSCPGSEKSARMSEWFSLHQPFITGGSGSAAASSSFHEAVSDLRTSEMFRTNYQFFTGPQVPPGHRSNIHQEVEEENIKEQEKREKDQTIREEPDEEPVKLRRSCSYDSLLPPERREPPVKRRCSIDWLPPDMSELRGAEEDKSSVGNFVLGEMKFSAQREPHSCLTPYLMPVLVRRYNILLTRLLTGTNTVIKQVLAGLWKTRGPDKSQCLQWNILGLCIDGTLHVIIGLL